MKKRIQKVQTRKFRKGLTLIELAVVVLIMGAILTIIALNINPGELKDQTAALRFKSDRSKIPSFLEIYSNKYGVYPTEEQGLSALVKKPDTGDISDNYSPIVRSKSAVEDPWGTLYILKYDENGNYSIITLGKDKKEGGEGPFSDFNILNEDEYPANFRKK